MEKKMKTRENKRSKLERIRLRKMRNRLKANKHKGEERGK